MDTIRIGIVGLGANTRSRHVPGLLACEGTEIVSVCNRRRKSAQAAAEEFSIRKTFDQWEELVEDPDIDAVVVGTWPNLHCPITLAAIAAGKHVLTEARMACNADEARQMLAASRTRPDLIAQIVPSPFGLRAHCLLKEMLAEGYLGELREAVVLGVNDAVADSTAPLHWRQDAELSGVNMLALGILHETLVRWVPAPTRVYAQAHTFTEQRRDAESGVLRDVTSPDSLRVLTEIPGDARGLYHLSGGIHHGPGMQIQLYGSEGTLRYNVGPGDTLFGARAGEELAEIPVPPDKASGWRVEEEFINAIRGKETIEFTDFATGVRYMEFTEAVAKSARTCTAVDVHYSENV